MMMTTRSPVLVLVGCWLTLTIAADDHKCEAPPNDAAYASSDPPCYFPSNHLLSVPVLSVREETKNTKVIKFGLPEGVSLSLPVSSCILMQAPGDAGKALIRPYNPISSNNVQGSFELLIKTYEEGKASKFAGALQPGNQVKFKQVKGNVKKFQYPFGKQSITMLAGGTGIAPMVQALHPLLSTAGDTTRVRLVYGNLSPQDIPLKNEIDALAATHPDRFTVHYVVGKTATDQSALDAGWTGEVGWIDEEKIKRLAYPPADDTVVWICGQPEMYTDLAGSRLKPITVGSSLHNLGYTDQMVWRS